jgi:hypothetical protein
MKPAESMTARWHIGNKTGLSAIYLLTFVPEWIDLLPIMCSFCMIPV